MKSTAGSESSQGRIGVLQMKRWGMVTSGVMVVLEMVATNNSGVESVRKGYKVGSPNTSTRADPVLSVVVVPDVMRMPVEMYESVEEVSVTDVFAANASQSTLT